MERKKKLGEKGDGGVQRERKGRRGEEKLAREEKGEHRINIKGSENKLEG